MDIQVTSTRPDGSFTWRQAGAKAPRGSGAAGLLPDGSKVGDVLRADIEVDMDGAVVLAIAPVVERKRNVTLIAVTGSGAEFKPVTEISTNKRNKPPRDKEKRPGRGGRRGGKPGANGAARAPRREFTPTPPELPKRPRATRLRPGDTHRKAVLETLTAAERVLAEKALDGGVGAVRRAVNEQNKQLKKDGKPEVNADALVNMVLELLPRLRVAEWKDSVEAVEKIIGTVDLRDLRAIVAKSNDATLLKDVSLNEKRDMLRAALDRRQNEEMQHWQDDLRQAVEVGRIVAALKFAAQPPKAGTLVPAELRARLVTLVVEQLTPLSPSERWVIVLEALAFSPIHNEVVPVGVPAKITPELTATVQRLAPLLPKIAALFGVVADPKARPPRPLRPEWQDRKKRDAKSRNGKPRDGKPQQVKPRDSKPREARPQQSIPQQSIPQDASPSAPAESAVAADN
jgi:hypothetical protein